MAHLDSLTPSPQRRVVPLWLIGLLTVMIIVLAVLVYYQFIRIEGPIPDDAGADYVTLEQGYTAQGFPRLGSPDAPVVVEDFSSYACPHCRDFHENIFPGLLDDIAAGQVQFIYIPVPHIGPGAANAARGLFCAGEQGKLWEMHDTLFAWQKQFLTRTFDTERLLLGAENLGLDTDAFETCLDAERTDTVVATAQQEFRQRGLTGTPSLFINGVQAKDYAEFDHLGTLAENNQTGS
jgi:protein-disulfide isomerase